MRLCGYPKDIFFLDVLYYFLLPLLPLLPCGGSKLAKTNSHFTGTDFADVQSQVAGSTTDLVLWKTRQLIIPVKFIAILAENRHLAVFVLLQRPLGMSIPGPPLLASYGLDIVETAHTPSAGQMDQMRQQGRVL